MFHQNIPKFTGIFSEIAHIRLDQSYKRTQIYLGDLKNIQWKELRCEYGKIKSIKPLEMKETVRLFTQNLGLNNNQKLLRGEIYLKEFDTKLLYHSYSAKNSNIIYMMLWDVSSKNEIIM